MDGWHYCTVLYFAVVALVVMAVDVPGDVLIMVKMLMILMRIGKAAV